MMMMNSSSSSDSVQGSVLRRIFALLELHPDVRGFPVGREGSVVSCRRSVARRTSSFRGSGVLQ